MDKPKLLEAIHELLKQYDEVDLDGEPIELDCDVVLCGSIVYRWNRDKGFNISRPVFPDGFEAILQELKEQGFSAGCSYHEEPKWMPDTKATNITITIYGDKAPDFKEYKGYPVSHRRHLPIFI